MKQNSNRIRIGKDLESRGKKNPSQPLWLAASSDLLSPRRNRPEVNVQTISRNTKEGSRVLIAGKVLGAGTIDHGVTVIAQSFSGGAKAKIKRAGGTCVALSDYAHDTNADVKGVLILG